MAQVLARRVERIREKENAFNILVRGTEGKRTLGKYRHEIILKRIYSSEMLIGCICARRGVRGSVASFCGQSNI